MHLLTTDDTRVLKTPEWELFMGSKVLDIQGDRRTCREWSSIQTAVRKADGEPGNKMKDILYRHYVPYQRIRDALKRFVGDCTIREAYQRLEFAIRAIYEDCSTFPISALQPPRKDSSGKYWASIDAEYTRGYVREWFTWAFEIICDYPNNIYYGRGSGDWNGWDVDVPSGGTYSAAQQTRVEKGAAKLYQVLSYDDHTGHCSTLIDVDENGKPRAGRRNELSRLLLSSSAWSVQRALWGET